LKRGAIEGPKVLSAHKKPGGGGKPKEFTRAPVPVPLMCQKGEGCAKRKGTAKRGVFQESSVYLFLGEKENKANTRRPTHKESDPRNGTALQGGSAGGSIKREVMG